jgi:Zn-finger nucleic acid-binding protein
MKCPYCKDVDLIVTELRGVEIERCPMCCGIWFDRCAFGPAAAEDRDSPSRMRVPAARREPLSTIPSARKRSIGDELRKGSPAESSPPKGPSR